MAKATLKNTAFFPEKTITDRDVYNYICKHSTVLDRFDPKKMVEMTQQSFMILSQPGGEKGLADELPKKKDWKFYRDYIFS